MKHLFWLGAILVFLLSCEREDIEPESAFQFVRPDHFPEPHYTFRNNPVTKAGFTLGRRLFKDPILSSDNSVACSNCHVKAVAFADPQHRLSIGFDDRIGRRNAPALANLAFMKEFFWDGRVGHLDFVSPNAIENEVEMNETLVSVVHKLNRDEEYVRLFRSAFGGIDSVTAPYMLHALSQYMNLLVSSDSKYDQYLQQEATLSTEELEGLRLFEQKCSSCHAGVLFTDQEYHNNGLDTEFPDLGRGEITEWQGDNGKFKTPSLRNVALTGPYMHDGRFRSLEEVLEHYQNGVKVSSTLDEKLQDGGQLGIPLTSEEKAHIISFLHTLTDYSFVSNEIF